MRFLILPIIFGDWVLFKLVSALFSLIMEIVDAKIFTSLNIDELITKVYIIVGVLMLFKLVISAIQYLINPDTFDDKEKGLFGILQRMAISVALLALFPVVFDYAMKMQSVVVAQLPKLILGAQYDTYDKSKIGEEISFTIVSNFIYPATDVLPAYVSLKGASNVLETIMTLGVKNIVDTALAPDKGITVGENGSIHDLDSFLKYGTSGCSFILPLPTCDFLYIPVLPLLVGIYMCFVLLSAAIDVVVRLIKLNIIRILAPIPITGYVFNKEKLTKFLKTFLQVYADLFIRLAAIYFTLFLLKFVVGELKAGIAVTNTTDWVLSAAVKVMVIIGILVFAKKAPKFITDLLGIEGVGESIGDMFKRAGGLFGGAVAAVGTGVSNFKTQKERAAAKGLSRGKQIAAGLRSAAAGVGSAGGRGAYMALQGKGFNEVRKNAFGNAIKARDKRIDKLDNVYSSGEPKYIEKTDANGNVIRDANGNAIMIRNPKYYGASDYRSDVMRSYLGVPSTSAFVKTRYDTMSQISTLTAEAKGVGASKMNETPDRFKVSFDLSKDADGNYIDAHAGLIFKELGYDNMNMEQVRNLYKMAQNGLEIEKADGTKTRVGQNIVDALGNMVQKIEKRTSYIKEAELMLNGDPSSAPKLDRIRLMIRSNSTMFTSPEIMDPILKKMNAQIKKVYPNAEVKNFNDLLTWVDRLDSRLNPELSKEPKREDFTSDTEYRKARDNYFIQIDKRANVLNGLKDAFEEVTKQQTAAAEIADQRAKRTQQAVDNNKSGK